MDLIEEPLAGLKLFVPKILKDERGYFFESYQQQKLNALGIDTQFVQDNESYSKQYTLRGLHYQVAPFAQAKLVRVVKGEVLDVAVDIRRHSETYGQYYAAILSDQNKHQLFIPRGFAHGYCVLSEDAIFCYKTDNFYNKEAEGGIRFDDPEININWNFPLDMALLSEKDLNLPYFGNHLEFV